MAESLPIPTPTVGGAIHFVIAFVVFILSLIVGLAFLAGLRSRGYDPVGKLSGLFVATPTAAPAQ